MRRAHKIVFSLLLGLAAGVGCAHLVFPGFQHAAVRIGKGAAEKPLFFNGNGGRQVFALSLKNLGEARDIEIRMEGGAIQSWYPPVVRMPFGKVIPFEGGKFRGVEPGRRVPVYVVFHDNGKNRKIEVVDAADGSVLRTIDILRGKGNERHTH